MWYLNVIATNPSSGTVQVMGEYNNGSCVTFVTFLVLSFAHNCTSAHLLDLMMCTILNSLFQTIKEEFEIFTYNQSTSYLRVGTTMRVKIVTQINFPLS